MDTAAPFHVRSATEADIPEMVAVLGETFQNGDVVGEFMFPDEKQRRVRQPRMFAALMRYRYIPEGGANVAVSDEGRIVGVVLWTRSWTIRSLRLEIKENLALLAAMKNRVIAGLKVEAAVGRGKPKQPHIYAMYLGVAKEWHGYGVAQALVGLVRDCAEAEGVAMYGNCQKKMLPFYAEAFPDGVLTGSTTLGRGGPPFYFLCREAVGHHAHPIA
jgi:hypothetical protein